MGIEGIDNLKGQPMNDEQQNQGLPGSQQGESADQPPQPTPPTPAHEETERVTPDAPADDDNQVIETSDPEPEPSNEDPGIDPEVPNAAASSQPSVESVEADQNDDKGEGV